MDKQNEHPPAGERIAKVIARAGLASRREAEAWIAAGRVAVNGKLVASPALNVGVRDRIEVDGQPLPTRERTRLFLYHKQRGLLTTHADPGGRPTIFGVLPKELPRLISVGRLDLNTEGLLLLTNDGGLARALELPATGWLRRYRVRAHGSVAQAQLDALRRGITIDGVRYGESGRRSRAGQQRLAHLHQSGNPEPRVKNVLGHLGRRWFASPGSFGPFRLGDLSEGAIQG
jgi:23S rRNA pseudouridine2605 synthase